MIAKLPGAPWRLAVREGMLFWTTLNNGLDPQLGRIDRAATTGGDVTTLATGLRRPTAIAVDTKAVYWLEEDSGDVRKVPLEGGTSELLAEVTPPAEGLRTHELVVADGRVYWTSDAGGGSILSVPVDGGAVVTLACTQPGVHGMAVDADRVYWTNAGDGTVRAVALLP